MPTTLAQLTANLKPVTVELNGDEINIEYYPMRITAEMLVTYASTGELQQMADDQALKVITSPGDTLLHVLGGWDIAQSVDEDGTPGPVEPITPETIARLGIVLQWALVHAIMQDAGNQGKATAPAASAKKLPSGATSSRKASSARSRTGIR